MKIAPFFGRKKSNQIQLTNSQQISKLKSFYITGDCKINVIKANFKR